MDSEINPLNQLLGQDNSFNIPSVMNTVNGGRLPFQGRNLQSLFSPAPNQVRNRMLPFQTPSPFKAQDYYYEDQNLPSPLSNNNRDRGFNNNISKVIVFDESPKFRPISNEPSTIGRAQNFADLPSGIHGKRNSRKNTKGLRNLSQSVYKIVLQNKVTTYKEVADELIRMLNAGQFGEIKESQDRGKDEQNIKRRVYDALNVLISADVLKKNGKYVISDVEMLDDQYKLPLKITTNNQSVAEIKDRISQKKTSIEEKKEVLGAIRHRKQLLEAIAKRNKKMKVDEKTIMPFPLIGINYNDTKKLQIARKNNSIRLINKVETNDIVGDLDMLLEIDIDIINQNIDEFMAPYQDHEEFLIKREEINSKKEQSIMIKREETMQKGDQIFKSPLIKPIVSPPRQQNPTIKKQQERGVSKRKLLIKF